MEKKAPTRNSNTLMDMIRPGNMEQRKLIRDSVLIPEHELRALREKLRVAEEALYVAREALWDGHLEMKDINEGGDGSTPKKVEEHLLHGHAKVTAALEKMRGGE